MTQEEQLEAELFNNKKVEFYSQLINAWLTTRMERDKTILTLSTAGLGVLVTFFNNISVNYNLIFYILALLSFIIAILSGLFIFSENADYCLSIVNEEPYQNEKLMKYCDKTLLISFLCGLFFSVVLSSIFIYEKNKKDSQNVPITPDKTILLLKNKYTNTIKSLEAELIKLKEIETNIEETKKLKFEIKENINKLSNELNNLEDINLLKEQRNIIQTKINKINKDSNEEK